MEKGTKPSEIIDEFLNFLKYCDKEYKDFLHDIEFAHNYDERCKIATRVHKQRNDRRAMKDRVEFVEKVAKFYSDKQNKQFIDRLKNLLADQKKAEEYVLNERHYNRRGDSNDID